MSKEITYDCMFPFFEGLIHHGIRESDLELIRALKLTGKISYLIIQNNVHHIKFLPKVAQDDFENLMSKYPYVTSLDLSEVSHIIDFFTIPLRIKKLHVCPYDFIPFLGLPSLSRLENLNFLEICSRPISTFPICFPEGTFPILKELSLYCGKWTTCNIMAWPSYLNSLEKLTFKGVNTTTTTSSSVFQNVDFNFSFLENLKEIKEISFKYCQFFTKFRSLVTVFDLLSYLSNLDKLQSLTLFRINQKRLTSKDCLALNKFNKLQTLTLDFDTIANLAFLENLTELRSLSLSGALSDSSPVPFPLSRLKNLEILDLSCKGIGDLSEISHCSNLRRLKLNCKDIEKFSFLADLTELEYLDLSGTNFSEQSFDFKKLSKLRTVVLPDGVIYEIDALYQENRNDFHFYKMSSHVEKSLW